MPASDEAAPAESAARPTAPGRLDTVLPALGLAASRTRAAREIRAGRVRVDGTVVLRPSAPVEAGALIELDDPEHWVARSAHKLLGALTDLEADGALAPDAVAGAVCLDAGASTGGFTQVLLERGAAAVHAVDVGHDQLVPALAGDARVHDLPGTNVRALTRTDLAARSDPPFRADGTVDLVVADLSFISLTLVVDALLAVCRPQAILLLMVKPQFELSRSALDKHGVVTREADRARAIARVVGALEERGAHAPPTAQSRLPGPAGNVEHFVLAHAPTPTAGCGGAEGGTSTEGPGPSATVERGAPLSGDAAPDPAPAPEVGP
jgi:23S rRNA (cytidine1920-2'-O)/16S rRNA (cytidine1409-2'-O)-methyltransferase